MCPFFLVLSFWLILIMLRCAILFSAETSQPQLRIIFVRRRSRRRRTRTRLNHLPRPKTTWWRSGCTTDLCSTERANSPSEINRYFGSVLWEGKIHVGVKTAAYSSQQSLHRDVYTMWVLYWAAGLHNIRHLHQYAAWPWCCSKQTTSLFLQSLSWSFIGYVSHLNRFPLLSWHFMYAVFIDFKYYTIS